MTTHTMFTRPAGPRRLLAALIVTIVCFWAGATAASQPSHAEIAGKSRALSVPFIANQGQVDPRVAFYARTFGGTVFVTRAGEIVYSLPAAKAGDDGPVRGLALRERLAGRKPGTVRGEGLAVTRVSEFQGQDPSRWRSGLPTYEAVSLGEVYEGIELRLRARGGSVEKIFTVKPGAKPADITLQVTGARALRVNERGQLEPATALGPVTFTKPVAFQEIEGRRVDVPVRYALRARGAYGFEVGAYDAGRPLVIDPLLASTLVGGAGWDRAYAIALERVGLVGYPAAVFIAGWTTSKRLPVAWGEMYDSKIRGPEDAFVAKLDADLTTLLAATFLGGRGIEEAWGLSLDESGNVYVAGWTSSGDFPTTRGAARRTYRGGRTDAFVSKLDNSLQNLLASTFLGGEREDRARGLVVVSIFLGSESVYVTGHTESRDFPNTVRPCCAEHEWVRGGTDAFVTRLASDLGRVLDSARLGGAFNDRASAIAAGGSDPAFYTGSPMIAITGCAEGGPGNATPDSHYPVTEHAYDRTPSNDGQDAFVTVLSWDLARLLGSTFLGGADGGMSSGDGTCGRAVAIDADNNVFVAGVTFSGDFVMSPGAYDETRNDAWRPGEAGICGTSFADRSRAERAGDVFVAKLSVSAGPLLDPMLGTLAASTFLGGCAADIATGLAFDAPSGDVFVAGYTYSPDFPTTAGWHDQTHHGQADGFVAKFDDDLTSLIASTFIGGSAFDAAVGLVLDAAGDVYVAGYTYSADFPTIPPPEVNWIRDAFVSKLPGLRGEIGDGGGPIPDF